MSGELRQGEILADIWEHRLEVSLGEQPPNPPSATTQSMNHPLMIILTQDCDLLQDYNSRSEGLGDFVEENHPRMLPHILCTDLISWDDIRSRFPGGVSSGRLRKNQEERHHFLPAGGQTPLDQELFLDFKKVFGLPTKWLYLALNEGSVRRVALVPPIFLHDLIHRFFAFQSRVALPE